MAASGVDTGANIPLELWDTRVETRADVVTSAPSTVGVNFDRIEPKVFASSIASKLMIDMPRVKSGTFTTGTINAGLRASSRTKGDAQESTAATFTVQSSTVKSVSARLSITIEDIAAIGASNFESALRENLSLALSAELDNQIINGNGTAPNLTGMFERLSDASAPATGIETWARFAAKHAGLVDGLWANELSDLSVVVGVDTYRLACSTFQGSDAEESSASYAKRTMAGFWTNSRMPAKATHIQKAILCRKGRSMMGAGEGIRLSGDSALEYGLNRRFVHGQRVWKTTLHGTCIGRRSDFSAACVLCRSRLSGERVIDDLIEIRSGFIGTVAPRKIVGVAVRYNTIAEVRDYGRGRIYRERVMPGAFGNLVDQDILLNWRHHRNDPVARSRGGGLFLDDSPEKLSIRADLPNSTEALDLWESVRGGVDRGLSVEMKVKADYWNGDLRTITRAKLQGIGVATLPVYDNTEVEARARGGGRGGLGREDFL